MDAFTSQIPLILNGVLGLAVAYLTYRATRKSDMQKVVLAETAQWPAEIDRLREDLKSSDEERRVARAENNALFSEVTELRLSNLKLAAEVEHLRLLVEQLTKQLAESSN